MAVDPAMRIRSMEQLAEAVERYGFFPFFKNSIPGFSVEEHIVPERWFADGDGVWEWKGPLIREHRFAYGRFFEKKTAWVTQEWFTDLANFRRCGYDMDALYEDGFAPAADRRLYELTAGAAPVVSRQLKALGDYGRKQESSFNAAMDRLQAEGYVIVSGFVYPLDRHGRPYGWDLAEYSTPELFFGETFTRSVYERTPEESYRRLLAHLREIFPETGERALRRFLGKPAAPLDGGA